MAWQRKFPFLGFCVYVSSWKCAFRILEPHLVGNGVTKCYKKSLFVIFTS